MRRLPPIFAALLAICLLPLASAPAAKGQCPGGVCPTRSYVPAYAIATYPPVVARTHAPAWHRGIFNGRPGIGFGTTAPDGTIRLVSAAAFVPDTTNSSPSCRCTRPACRGRAPGGECRCESCDVPPRPPHGDYSRAG